MKKILLFLLTLMLGFSTLQLSAQETLTVHNGTTTNSYIPVYGFYADAYLKAEFVIPANELSDMTDGSISGMKFYSSQTNVSWGNADFQVFLTEVNSESINAFEGPDNATIVYTGALSIANGEMEITFSTEYTYNGGNLLVGIYNTVIGSYVSSSWYGETVSGASVQGYSYSNLSSVDPSQRNFIPKTTFTYIPQGVTCFSPNSPIISDISASTATLSWTPRDGQSAWEVCCLTDEDDIELASWTSVTDTFYTFSSLIASTHYTAYVRTICGTEISTPRSASSFYTLCSGDAMPLPFSENFEGTWTPSSAFGQNHDVPLCWTIYDGGVTSSSYQWKWQRSTTAHVGNAAAACYTDFASDAGTHHNDWLITPPITLTGNQQVTFYAQRSSSSTDEPEEISIWISDEDLTLTAPANDTMPLPGFTQVSQFDIPQGEWALYEISLAGYSGNRHVAFVRRNSPNNGYWLRLDDVLIDDVPSCLQPSNNSVSVSNITATTVNVDWTPTGDETAWEVVVVPTGDAATTGTPIPASNHPFTVTDLDDNTTYDIFIRADCNGDYSYWTLPKTFTTYPHCSSPLNVNVSQITGSSALVTWNPASFGATSYTVEYSLASEESWSTELVDGTQYMISNLEPDSTYHVMVYSNCDLGTADTVHKNFTTKHCLVGGDLQIDEGTSTTSYYPTYSCYNYSYTQQIFLASEMNGAANINSIAVDVYSIASNSRQISIYLMHTTAASGDLLPTTNAQLVYSGTFSPVIGWNTINFTTPFQYNGTSNLALIVIDATGSYSCSNYYNCHTASATLSHCEYQDNTPYSINNIPSGGYSDISSTRCNIIFGTDCDNDATCVRPNVYVTETSENSVTLDWAPGYTESSWEVEYSDNDSVWTPAGTTNTHPYEVTGLNANTKYYFQVRSDCGAEQSNGSVASARTECSALTMDQIPYSENFEDVSTIYSTTQGNYILCWDRYASDPDHYVYIPSNSYAHSGTHFLDFHHTNSCFNIAILPEMDATINASDMMVSFYACRSGNTGSLEVGVMSDKEDPTSFETVSIIDLSAAETYEYVEQHISLEDYTGDGAYVAFRVSNAQNCGFYIDDVTLEERPNCMYPAAVTVDSVSDNSVTISWTAIGTATAWNIEYATSDITPGEGHGTLISNVTDNPYTIDNLAPATTYYIYIQSDCGSPWVGPVTATPGQYIMAQTGSDTLTTCGTIIYDNGGANGDYSNNCNSTLVLYPANSGDMMMITGTNSSESKSSGGCWDYLQIYDGVGTSGTQLVNSCGTNQTISAVSTTGPLTIYFYSDGSNVEAGFALLAQCTSCYPPTNVTASNPTLNGATITWSGNSDSYVLFLNGDMSNGYPASDTTYTFSELNSSTVYSVQVLSVCDGDSSMLSAAATFATSCDAITITVDNPWTEDFENYQGSGVQQFVCWDRPITQVVDDGTAPFVYCGYGQAAHSGTNTAELKGTLNMLALPQFTNNLSELRLSFWATGFSYSNTNVEVGYITDINDTSTFVAIANAGTPGSRGSSNGGNGNYMGPFSFSNVTVANARIALRYTGSSASSGWNLDDFIVEIAPECESPVKTSVRATNIGGHVATISWVDNDDTHSSWTVYYRETSAGNDDPWDYVTATDTFVTITGLDPVTSYDVYVITNCTTPDANPDATHTISFTTTVACPAPTGLTLASVSSDEATVTWNGTASSYNVIYGETGFSPSTGGQEGTADTESYTMTNLTPNTSYTIYVNSDCSDANDSLSTTVSFTFRTTQVPEQLPYTADFTAANEWVLNNGTCTNYWATGTVNATPSLFVTNNGTTPGYSNNSSIVSAEKLLTVGDNTSVNINFDVYAGGESSWDYLKVFFAPAENAYPAATSVPDYADYSYSTYAIDFQNYLSQTGYTSYRYKLNLTNDTLHIAVEMPNPNANPTSTSTAKLVFVWRNDGSTNTQPGAIISNVTVAVNNCPMPSNLTVDNITINSADISWTSGDEVSAWILEYQAAGESTWTIENIATTPEHTLNNLATATTYTVRVKSDCSSEESGYQTITFTTSCGTVTSLPYTENFDNISSGNANAFPTCWARPIQYSGYPYAVTAYQHSAPASLRFQSETTTPTTAVTPQFAEDIHNLQLNFWLKAESITYSGTFEVGVMTDPNDVSTFVGVWTIQPTSTSWIEYTLNFDTTAVSGINKYIAFRQHSNSSSWYYWLDDVTIDLNGTPTPPSPTCDVPTNLNATATAYNAADVNWTAGGTETSWNLQYKTASATDWGNSIEVNATTYHITGLNAETEYQVRVQAVCSDTTSSEWTAPVNFTTPAEPVDPCDAPTGLTVSNITHNSATVSWTAGGDETSWSVQYKSDDASQWQEANVQTTSHTIEGLAPQTHYAVRVKAVCAPGNESGFLNGEFTTNPDAIDNITLANSINLMPNPADNYIDLRINSNVNVKEAVVYNAFGQMVQTVELNDNYARIDLNNMAAGMYFVRVNSDNMTATKKFIKR